MAYPATCGTAPGQPVADGLVADARRDGADHPAVGVTQGCLAAGRAAEGADVDLPHLVPGQGPGGVGGDAAADQRRVGVRVADALPVQDDDVLGAGGPPDPLRRALHRVAPDRLGAQQVAGEVLVARHGLGDGERAVGGLVVELVAERGEEEPGGQGGHADGDDQLDQQHLRGHPARGAQRPRAGAARPGGRRLGRGPAHRPGLGGHRAGPGSGRTGRAQDGVMASLTHHGSSCLRVPVAARPGLPSPSATAWNSASTAPHQRGRTHSAPL